MRASTVGLARASSSLFVVTLHDEYDEAGDDKESGGVLSRLSGVVGYVTAVLRDPEAITVTNHADEAFVRTMLQ